MERPRFDPHAIPRAAYDERINELAAEYKALMAAAENVNEEIRWLIHGRDQFAQESGFHPAQTVLEQVADLAPPGVREDVAEPPNIRAKIHFVIREGGNRPMQPIQVIEALRGHGWMPTAESAPQMVRNRMLSMLHKEQLERDDDGYWLTAYPKGGP